jgi:predicted SnoaL-like aldol condensation-catalyzing enzyme
VLVQVRKIISIDSLKDLRSNIWMSNKKIATSFLETAALGNPREAFEKFVSPKFIHHNQYFKGDRLSLLKAMEEASKTSPNKSFAIKQIIEENDKVITYSQVMKTSIEIAVFHMFRFEHGLIVELWDVGQPISKDCPNENGLF